MTDEQTPLTPAERAELEQLRAEKQERERAEQIRRERAELEQLRAERAAQDRGPQVDGATGRRAESRSIMEPGDDLSMPIGQKIVLVVLALVVLAIIATFVFSPR